MAALAVPAGWERIELPDGLRLVASEGASARAIGVVLLAGWLLFRAVPILRLMASGASGGPALFQLLLTAAAVYLAAAALVNRTVLELRGERFTWVVGPLPLPGTGEVSLEAVRGFSLRTVPSPRRKPGPPWIELRVAVDGGQDGPVGRPMPEASRAEAEWLRDELEAARTRVR